MTLQIWEIDLIATTEGTFSSQYQSTMGQFVLERREFTPHLDTSSRDWIKTI